MFLRVLVHVPLCVPAVVPALVQYRYTFGTDENTLLPAGTRGTYFLEVG